MSNDKLFYRVVALAILALIATNVILVYRAETTSQQKSAPIYVSSQDGSSNLNVIKVTGTGRVYASPDIAVLTIGVETRSEDAQNAQQRNAEKMNNVIEALMNDDISEDNIKTISYRLEPVIRYEDGTNIIIGYVAENKMQVKLGDISDAGRVIDLAVAAGANEISFIEFSLSEDRMESYREQAMDAAVQNANLRAETISKSMGVQLIGPLEVNLIPSYEPITRIYEAQAAVTPITPGELEILSTVEITYQFQ
ncbi:MAG: SIMPL domain-containing protein [Candidatus Bathyarchaeota archaeon]|nr:SIMPL domain-containing protein [Candidatus Bathyarchaeota archaeon]